MRIIHVSHSKKSLRIQAAYRVAENWRIRQRLPRVTKLATSMSLIKIKKDVDSI
jgi:hypothetical protein